MKSCGMSNLFICSFTALTSLSISFIDVSEAKPTVGNLRLITSDKDSLFVKIEPVMVQLISGWLVA